MAATKSADAIKKVLDGPAMLAPSGMKNNFVNPSNLETELYIDLAICLTVSFLAVGMRLWTKARLIQKVEIEDWVCLFALATFAGYCAYIFYTIKVGGTGVHQWNLQLKTLSKQLYQIRIGATFYGFVIFVIKLAIFLQYLRIFCTGRRNITFWICHTLIWLNFLFYTICAFIEIFPCYPVHNYWKPWLKGGRCLDVKALNVVAASFNSASDISILIVPQKVIWNLQMSLRKKLGVSAIFFAGVCACFSSIVRLYYSVRLFRSQDVTYYVGLMGLWTLPEMTSGFLAMCLPVCPRFFQSFKPLQTFPRLSTSRRGSSGKSGYKRSGYRPSPNQSTSPSSLLARNPSTVWLNTEREPPVRTPTKKWIATSSVREHLPAEGTTDVCDSSMFEPGNSHIMRCIQISTTTEPRDANPTPGFTKGVSTFWE